VLEKHCLDETDLLDSTSCTISGVAPRLQPRGKRPPVKNCRRSSEMTVLLHDRILRGGVRTSDTRDAARSLQGEVQATIN
jgi:hypothetical protein